MLVQCPHCGKSVVVQGLGRKACDIPFKNVLNALQNSCTVRQAVENLRQEFNSGSVGYIYNQCRAHGIKPLDVIRKNTFIECLEGKSDL